MGSPKTMFSLIMLLAVGLHSSPWGAYGMSHSNPACSVSLNGSYTPAAGATASDAQNVEVALNLEYLEAEFFCWGAYGYGLDVLAPTLPEGGPKPLGVQVANLDPVTRDIVAQFCLQEIGHLRAIKSTIRGFPRPLLDLSPRLWQTLMTEALGVEFKPPFNPYANSINYLLASYVIPYVGLTGYVGASPNLEATITKRLVAGLLGVESGQDAIIRLALYYVKNQRVSPSVYLTIAEATDKLSQFRNFLGKNGNVDEGLVVPLCLGAEGNITGNTLSADSYSVSYARTPAEIFRIVYGTGNESQPGGFYPNGGNGAIAQSLL